MRLAHCKEAALGIVGLDPSLMVCGGGPWAHGCTKCGAGQLFRRGRSPDATPAAERLVCITS